MSDESGQGGDELFELAAAGLAIAGLWKLGESFTKYSGERERRKRESESDALVDKGQRLQGGGQLNEAAVAYRDALVKNPYNSRAANALAWLFTIYATHRAQLDQAMVLAERAVAYAPDAASKANHLDTRAEIFIRRGDLNEAIVDFQNCLRLLSSRTDWPAPAALHRLGVCQAQQGELVKAAATLREAVEAAPGNVAARVALIRVTRDLSDFDQSAAEARAVLGLLREQPALLDGYDADWVRGEIWCDLGVTLYLAGRQDEAEQAYLQSMAACARNPYPLANYAIIRGAKGSPAELRKFLNQALSRADPSDPHFIQSLLQEAVDSDQGDEILAVLIANRRITHSMYNRHREAWTQRREKVRLGSNVYVRMEGGSFMTGDSYINQGNAIAMGRNATGIGTNQQINTGAGLTDDDLKVLLTELVELKKQLLAGASQPEHYHAVAEIDAAKAAAETSDRPAIMRHLAAAGRWALDMATKIGAPVAEAALKAALNAP